MYLMKMVDTSEVPPDAPLDDTDALPLDAVVAVVDVVAVDLMDT